jgi:heme-degrading monooxygenase HmoA
MFSVIFEVNPHTAEWNTYLDTAKMLRPELEVVEGFVDNIRYKSLERDGWILSLSGWRDEKAVVRWRTKMRHHEAQQKGRDQILQDYHLRVGQITKDTEVPPGMTITEQRLDETEVGEGTTVTLISMKRPAEWKETTNPADCAQMMGLDPRADGMLDWDIFDAVLTPGDLILLISWKDHDAAEHFEDEFTVPENARLRRVRVVRDYSMFDRREAPQYYADAKGRETVRPR